MANLPLAFAELLGGGVLLTAGLTGHTIQDVFSGKVTPGTPASSSGGGSSAPAPTGEQGNVSRGDLTFTGAGFGWATDQLDDWWRLIGRESGGRADAVNPSSGAFGIGQFLGATKTAYAKYGATSTDPLEQLNAMAVYIHNRYGTPSAAWAHEQEHGWY